MPEVDALLRGLELPLGPGETARERADLLHEIIEDEQVRDYTGSGGHKVAHVAVMQLGELGFPYALEVPPELFAQARAAGRGGASPFRERSERGGADMVMIAGGLEVLLSLFLATRGRSLDVMGAMFLGLGVSLTSFVPALPWVAISGYMLRVTVGKGLYAVALLSLLPLGMALLRLGGARELYGSPPDEE